MVRAKTPINVDQREAQEVWARNLAQIRTYYGRLVYLAGLRNSDTGEYEHYSFDGSRSKSSDRVIRQVHETIFREWVSFSLERKKLDVEAYIAAIDLADKADLIEAWLRLTPYKNLVPAAIQGPERKKHISDFEAILGLLKNVYGVGGPGPDA
jgi:hypothetical protein